MSDQITPSNRSEPGKKAPPKGARIYDRPERPLVPPVVIILGLVILLAIVAYFLFYHRG